MEAGPKYAESLNLDFGCHAGCVQGIDSYPYCHVSVPQRRAVVFTNGKQESPKAWIVVMREVHALPASQSKDTIQESLLNTLPR